MHMLMRMIIVMRMLTHTGNNLRPLEMMEQKEVEESDQEVGDTVAIGDPATESELEKRED